MVWSQLVYVACLSQNDSSFNLIGYTKSFLTTTVWNHTNTWIHITFCRIRYYLFHSGSDISLENYFIIRIHSCHSGMSVWIQTALWVCINEAVIIEPILWSYITVQNNSKVFICPSEKTSFQIEWVAMIKYFVRLKWFDNLSIEFFYESFGDLRIYGGTSQYKIYAHALLRSVAFLLCFVSFIDHLSFCLFQRPWCTIIKTKQTQGPFLLTWINFNTSRDK